MEKNRTCYNCEHFTLCRVFFAFQEVINKAGAFFDCDLPMEDPRHWQNILVAVANSCEKYKFKPEE